MVFDLAVIGGGPAGLIAAREASRKGLDVILFEEDPEIGEPERCAGLLNLAGLRRLSIPLSRKYVQNILSGAIFYVCGKSYVIDAQRPVAAVVNRKHFDQELARQAEKAGAQILCETRVKDVEKKMNSLMLRTTSGDFHASWVIDAEGAGAMLLRKFLGVCTNESKWIPIIQLFVEDHELDKRYAHIYFKKYLPDFFAYLIPIDQSFGKLGVASRGINLEKCLHRFLAEEFPNVRILKEIRYVIYTGFPLDYLDFSKRFIPVGDAAGHVKATTGGGVIMGGLISMNIASAIAETVGNGNPTPFIENAIQIIRELRRIALLRTILQKIPQSLYGLFLGVASSETAGMRIASFWDMDFQVSSLVSGLLGRRFGLYYSSRGFSRNE